MFKKCFAAGIMLCSFISWSCAQPLDDALTASWAGDHAAALQALTPAADVAGTANRRGWEYLESGDTPDAVEAFGKGAAAGADYDLFLGLGIARFLNGEPAGANEAFQQALAANKHCAAAEYLMGLICVDWGALDEAEGHFRKALKLDYNLTEARLQIARICDGQERWNDAYREWARLADIDPGFREAQQRKQELLAFITKKPEEIIPPKRIAAGMKIAPPPAPEKLPQLRIGIVQRAGSLTLWSEGGLVVSRAARSPGEVAPRELFTVDASAEQLKDGRVTVSPKDPGYGIVVRDVRDAEGFAWAGTGDREYRGTMEITASSGTVSLVNTVTIEEYVYSVLPSEMIGWWPEESLKVQAVIARTQAIYRANNMKPHHRDGFDLCATQHCQVYKGVRQETAKARKVVDETRGQYLASNGRPVHTLFSSNCSGHTLSSADLKGWGDAPYLQGSFDGEGEFPSSPSAFERWIKFPPAAFCAPSKYTYYAESRWVRVISQEEMAERLNRTARLGGIKKISAVRRSASGHIALLRIEGTDGSLDIDRENVIRSMALGRLRSTNFIVEGLGDNGEGLPKYFIFWGAGWGHAVGLCQSGVAGMAEKGYTYDAILKKYYRNTEILNAGY